MAQWLLTNKCFFLRTVMNSWAMVERYLQKGESSHCPKDKRFYFEKHAKAGEKKQMKDPFLLVKCQIAYLFVNTTMLEGNDSCTPPLS